MDRDRGGAGPMVAKREEFVRLINAGLTITDAAREVGVARKTGNRWMHGWTYTTLSGEVIRYPSVFQSAATAGEEPVGVVWSRAAGGRGRGRPPLVEQRRRFVELIKAGLRTTEAARQVGVTRRTGSRWRHGVTTTSAGEVKREHPSVCQCPVVEISSRFLSEAERRRIGDLRRQGRSVRAIAGELGRAPSTISRELRRNASGEQGAYFPFDAQAQAVVRRGRPGRGKLIDDLQLQAFVAGRLGAKWSPEQIAHALREEFPGQSQRHLAVETIYHSLYRGGILELADGRPAVLRTGRRRRRRHRRPDARRPQKFAGMTPLSLRPVEAADRAQPGHWEGDLIIGAKSRSAIGTVVERTSRFTILLHLPGGRHTAEAVRDALVTAMAALPVELRRSLTWDQGSELALHADVAAALGMPVFFCDPHSPWQRPTNENTNGLLREYFPKSTNLRLHSAADLAAAAAELNDRPRKVLGWATPAQRLAALR